MSADRILEILDKLSEATDALALLERAVSNEKESPLVMGCGFVGEFIDEAVALVEALREEAAA